MMTPTEIKNLQRKAAWYDIWDGFLKDRAELLTKLKAEITERKNEVYGYYRDDLEKDKMQNARAHDGMCTAYGEVLEIIEKIQKKEE